MKKQMTRITNSSHQGTKSKREDQKTNTKKGKNRYGYGYEIWSVYSPEQAAKLSTL